MDVLKLRYYKEMEIRLILEQKFSVSYFNPDYILNDAPSKCYEKNLSIFRYLFSGNENERTYLWNKCYFPFGSEDLTNQLKKDDFSEKELEFFSNIRKQYMENERLYGIYLPNTNINKKIISDRLSLVPYLIDDMECEDTYEKYWNYLGKNPLEFA